MKHSITPHITEKTYRGITEDVQVGQTYTFKVTTASSKTDVKKLVEDTYKVNVVDVRIVRLPGKVRRFKGIVGHTNPTKKALVRVAVGDRIAAFDSPTSSTDKQ
jgi:large subunit ribosomal protein L23